MAIENERSSNTIVLLGGLNYATWQIQCKMALILDNLWTHGVEGGAGTRTRIQYIYAS